MRTLMCAAAVVALLGAVGCGRSDTRPTVASDKPVLQGLKGGGRGGDNGANPPAHKGAGRSAPVGGQGLKSAGIK
ncbi:MAG TPA: hypothetical protein VFG68_11100 [Fimbriiglobus sp.]|nr:hypothetical protein [Fimbriiglobus sp.]